MAVIFNNIIDSYNYIFYDACDERTKDWFPSHIFILICMPAYYYFSKHLGPHIMKEREPFQLKNTIFYYNLFQIAICIYIFYEGLLSGWINGYSWTCQPVDETENPISWRMINAVWWYTVVKIIDLLDTIFFVLRKKDNQITFLHIFHHTGMPVAGWVALKYFPNGHATFLGVINSFIHIIMYTYYLLAGLGPQYQKYLWWKKYLTSLQLVQFAMIFVHNFIPLFNPGCSYPKWIHTLLCIHSLQFIYLFGSFYYNSYIINKPKPTQNGSSKLPANKTKTQ